MQHGQGFLGLAHDEVFGDFQLQAAGLQAVVGQQLFDAGHEVRLAQLCAGEVDGERAEGLVGFAPCVHLQAGLFDHPVADLQDHAVLFGQRYEVLRRHFAEGRVAPADQGFGTDHGVGVQAGLGLERQAQFVAVQCASQFLLERDAFAGLGGEVTGVAFDAVAAFGFGAVHGRVGVFDQRGDVCAVGGEQAAADAGADEEFVFSGLKRRTEAGQQFVGDADGVAGLQQAGQQDDELITAEPGDGVDVAQVFLEALGDAFEQQVADRVSEAVVDVFEAVQVQKQHGAQASGLFAVQQGGLQAVFEQGAVGQAGEGVVVGLVVQACLSVLEAGDVGEHGDEMGDEVVLVAHGADGQPARVDVAVLAAVIDFALPVAFRGQLMPHRGIESAVVLA